MEADKLKAIIADMRANPDKYDQRQKDLVLQGMQQEAAKMADMPKQPPQRVQEGLTPEESVKALKQYTTSIRQNEWQKQKDWDQERQRFAQAMQDFKTLGVPHEKLQPFILRFLEKEAEMNNRAVQIPMEKQKQTPIYKEYEI